MTGSQPFDIDQVTRDALLLDALGRGDPPPAGDEVAVMLAAWRDDLSAGLPTLRTAAPGPASSGLRSEGAKRPGDEGRRRLRGPGAARAKASARITAAAAVVVALVGALTLAAGAEPGSPLWPITRIVYGDHAEERIAERDAEQAIAGARTAIAEGRYADAERLLDVATEHTRRVGDVDVAGRLLAEIDAVRGLLPGAAAPPTEAPSTAVPTVGPPTPSPGGAPAGGGAGPTGGPGLPVPSLPLPSLPLPSLPLPPLPSLPLPPLPLDGG